MINLYYIENIGCDDTTHGLSYMTDREIQEKEEKIVESKHKTICDRCKSSGICKYSDHINYLAHAIERGTPFIKTNFECEYFNPRKEN